MLQQLARLLAPPSCARCDYEGSLVCQNCWEEVFQLVRASCPGVTEIVAAGPYRTTLRELVKRLKYMHQREAATIFAQALLLYFEPKRFDIDAVTAVPVVASRFRQRGYNQAELIAKQLARELLIPYRRLLYRARATQQVGKSRFERGEHVKGAFGAKGNLEGIRVLLVDDVLTTGATISECAQALRAAGATVTYGAVAARD